MADSESKEDEYARWIVSILEAKDEIVFNMELDAQKLLEIEDTLLRQIGIRAPLHLHEKLGEHSTKAADRAYLKGMKEMARLARYFVLLTEEAPDWPTRWNKSEKENASLKGATWRAARSLFFEIGGGCSAEHIRLTLQGWARDAARNSGKEERYPFPVPTGDPPPVKSP